MCDIGKKSTLQEPVSCVVTHVMVYLDPPKIAVLKTAIETPVNSIQSNDLQGCISGILFVNICLPHIWCIGGVFMPFPCWTTS